MSRHVDASRRITSRKIIVSVDRNRQLARAAGVPRGPITAVTGTPFGGQAVTSARLFSGPPVGSKHEARKLVASGHLKETRKLAFSRNAGRYST
jgi:hypothetical protein